MIKVNIVESKKKTNSNPKLNHTDFRGKKGERKSNKKKEEMIKF